MPRQCVRPGCDRPAAARLTYDTVAGAVWLERPIDGDEPAQQVCSVHAATLTVPLGWTVTDRRSLPEPQRAGRGESAVAEDPPAEDPPAEAPSPAEEPTSAEELSPDTPAAAEEPRPTRGKPEAGEPAARARRKPARANGSNLLDRAFEWTGPQRSVLTQRGESARPPQRSEAED